MLTFAVSHMLTSAVYLSPSHSIVRAHVPEGCVTQLLLMCAALPERHVSAGKSESAGPVQTEGLIQCASS